LALLAGLLLAGSAGLVATIAPARDHVIALDLSGTQEKTIKVSATATGVQRGSVATVTVNGRTRKGVDTPLFLGTRTADSSGLIAISGEIKDVPLLESCRAQLLIDNAVRREVAIQVK
jgi:hypothetical protein